MKLCDKTACELHEMLVSRKCSAKEILADVAERAAAVQNDLNCYITFNEEAAAEAEKADRMIASGEEISLMTGIPVAVKDNISTKGLRTTCASKMLENYVPPYDAAVIERLRASGAVIIGKTNMDEFAMGSASDTGIYGSVYNSADHTLSAGGSSGGSAATVASGGAVLALGSDTGGSVRQPASFCGVVGFCPSYGAVSRYGLIAFASSIDRIGPIGKNVKDTVLLHNIINGYDSKDVTTFRNKNTFSLNGQLKGLKIGIPDEVLKTCMDKDIGDSFINALSLMKSSGAITAGISLPLLNEAVKAYYIISSAEASSNLARFDGVRYGYRAQGADTPAELFKKSRTEGFGDEVKRRIMLGTFVLSEGYAEAYYKRALSLRSRLCSDFDSAFENCDIIAMPVYPKVFIKSAEQESLISRYTDDIFTVPPSLAGLPAVSVPCGRSRGGLPIGLQLIGRRYMDHKLLDVAYGFELAGGSHE